MKLTTIAKPLGLTKFFYCVFVILWLLSSPNHIFAGDTFQLEKDVAVTKKEAITTLTMTVADSTVKVNSNTGLYDFEQIDPLVYNDSSGYTIAHSFTLVNNSKKAIIVNRVELSDPRITYNLPDIQKQLPVTLPSGDIITIEIHYQLLPLSPGALSASASVFVNNQAQPAATLELKGVIEDSVVFDPSLLDFGEISSGETVSKTLKVFYDPHMYPSILPLPPDKLPFLVGDQNFITVKRTAISSSKGASPFKASFPRGYFVHKGMSPLNDVVTYLVTVTPPATGPFRGYLSILPIEGTIGYEVLKTRSVVVQGEVSSKTVK